jgi:hypothetical protein
VSDATIDRLIADPDAIMSLIELETEAGAVPSFLKNLFPRLMGSGEDHGKPSKQPGSKNEGDTLCLEKCWHGIHFTLTRDALGGNEPLCYLVQGGQEVGEDLGYGPARALRPAQTAAFATALAAIDRNEFARRFDPAAMEQNDIYPQIWDEDRDELIEEFAEQFNALQTFVTRAAKKKLGLLIYLS